MESKSGSGGDDSISKDETDRLISSSKVEGTTVYDRQGERLGTVSHFMVDKYTGQVAYAVMASEISPGSGTSHHPLPWRVLTYDTRLGGYVVDLDRGKLEGAPRYKVGEEPDWADQAYGKSIHDYYGVPLYLGAH